jgi:O-antigen/teichoic acid export membrane protein
MTPPPAVEMHDPARKQLRGSSLLLLGRMLSIGINFLSQMTIVRYLSTQDYGALAYALAAVSFFEGLSTLGLKRGVSRFAPIYHEHRDLQRLFGLIALAIGTTLLMGAIIIGGLYAFPDTLARLVNSGGGRPPLDLLLVLIFLVPVEALDGLLIGLFASFARPGAIFFRKHVLGPGLKLAVVVLLVAFRADVLFLAWGYLAASSLGVLLYGWVLVRFLRRDRTLAHFDPRRLELPIREVFAFTIPALTSDLVGLTMNAATTLFLGYFHDTVQVAMYRVVLPAAHVNSLVNLSFSLLYTPLAARLFARQDHAGINTLYWRTAIWMAVLSFPIFALTFSLAKPITVLLYGARYESSWPILQLLSLGYFFNVALGFNGLTLKVLGKLRYVVIINAAAVLANLVLSLVLVPRYGALGAGIATAGALIFHNILKQAGLRLVAGLSIFEWQYLSFYMILAAAAAGLLLVQRFVIPSLWVTVPIAALVSLLVLALTREKLRVEETFPELLRLPGIGHLLRWMRVMDRA